MIQFQTPKEGLASSHSGSDHFWLSDNFEHCLKVVLPSMGINSGVVNSAGDGDAGGDGVHKTEDDVPGSPGARCGEDRGRRL